MARRLEEDVPRFEIHPNHKLKKLSDENFSKVKQHLANGRTFPRAVKHVLPGASAPREHGFTRYSETELVIINADTTSAVRNCNREGLVPVCAHSFANRYNPGGGYLKGSSAQEEDLCRMHLGLFPSINHRSSFYPIHANEALLSKGIELTREPGTLKYGVPIATCDIVTNAMPDLRKSGGKRDAKWRQAATTSIRAFLYTAMQSRCPHVMTGAFGCGAFKNPPDQVAEIYVQLLGGEFRGAFKTVIFPIVDTKGRGNLLPFQRQLKLLDPRHCDPARPLRNNEDNEERPSKARRR